MRPGRQRLRRSLRIQDEFFPAVQFSRYFRDLPRSLKTIQCRRTSVIPCRILHPDFPFPQFPVYRPVRVSPVRRSTLPRKEVIQPHLPIRLPCYDFTPVIGLTFDGCSLSVGSPASGAPNSHGVTGGVYKARERIHRGMLIRDY